MTTYTINQAIEPTNSNSSTNISISQTADKTIRVSSPYNRNALKNKLTVDLPVIFSTRIDSKPVIMYTRTDAKPIIFYLRESLVVIYKFLRIGISQFINNLELNFVSSFAIGRNLAKAITNTVTTSNSSVTINEEIDMSGLIESTNDDDTEDKTEDEPTAVGSSTNITINQTADKTAAVTTSYTTVVA